MRSDWADALGEVLVVVLFSYHVDRLLRVARPIAPDFRIGTTKVAHNETGAL